MSDAADPTAILDESRAGERILRGGAVRAFGYVLSTLLSLAGVAFVTRHLGPTEYGRYQTVFSLITIVGAMTDAGMGALGIREYAQLDGDRRAAYMRALLGLRIVLTLIGMVIAVAISAALGFNTDLLAGTALAGAGLALTVIQTTLSIPLSAELRNEALTAIDLLRQVLQVIGLIGLVLAGYGAGTLLAVPLPVGIVVVVVVARLTRGRIPRRPTISPTAWGAMLRPALIFALATAVGTMYAYAAQVITQAVSSPHQAGLFAASFRVFIVTAAIPGLLVTVAFPLLSRAARDDRTRLRYALQRLFETMALLGIGATLGLAVAAPAVIEVMAGSGFRGAVTPLRVQSFAMLASFVLSAWGFALLSLHRHTVLLRANLAALIVGAAGVAVLASAHGALGGAIGSTVAEVVLAASYLIGLIRTAPELRPEVGRPLRALASGLAAGAVALLSGLPAVPASLLALLLYAALVLVTGAVPAEILEVIRPPGGRPRP